MMAVLNLELNGVRPSDGLVDEEGIPRSLAYAISEVIGMLRGCAERREGGEERRILERFAWRAETAWSAVLAGDIDDLHQHLEDTERMRFGSV
jgi:hypothetical protein